jgi:hypothetical protein
MEFKFKQIGETDHYKLEILEDDKPLTKIELAAKKNDWIEIAKNNPLNGVAFIQELAKGMDLDAIFLQCVYQTYKKFLENGETVHFERLTNSVLARANSPSFKFYLATYIKMVIEGDIITDKQVLQAKEDIHTLIPGFEKVLLSDMHKVHPEQKIHLPSLMKPHNAFPDLIKFKGETYIAFREGNSHANYQDLGSIRILKGSYNHQSKIWNFITTGLLSDQNYDLRDPRFFINGNEELMLILGASKIDEKGVTTTMVPHVAKLANDKWKLQPAIYEIDKNAKKGEWIWRVTWNDKDKHGYALSYGLNRGLNLLKTLDGIYFEKVSYLNYETLNEPYNEATIRFKEDGTMIALIRTERQGLLGQADFKDEYSNWKFFSLPFRLGGPNFVIRKNGDMIAGTRFFFLNDDNTVDFGTVVGYMDEKTLIPLIRLKSCGDNSYPGMVLEDNGDISVLYYSGCRADDENACKLYITRIRN